MAQRVTLAVNGRAREEAVEDNLLLIDYLRERRGLTGTKRGCDGGECGASCEGRAVETIESQNRDGTLSALQRAFHDTLGTQCGFCTPGMIMAASALLRRNPRPAEAEIREALGGNLCRCTGYVKIIEAVKEAAR